MKKHPKFMVERFKIFKVAVVLILMYRFHAIIVKIHARFFGGLGGFVCLFFAEIDKLILKFTWKYRGSRIAKTILNKIERLSDFKTYYKEIVIKTA